MSSVYVWMFWLKCLELLGQQEDCSICPVRWNCSHSNSSWFVERPVDQSARINADGWRQTTAAGNIPVGRVEPCRAGTCTPEQLFWKWPAVESVANVDLVDHMLWSSGSCDKTSGSVLDDLQFVQHWMLFSVLFTYSWCIHVIWGMPHVVHTPCKVHVLNAAEVQRCYV